MSCPARTRLIFVVLACGLQVGCRSPYYADRGAALGGVTGAVTGAAIGKAAGNTGAGAVIGTAVGALTGAAIGDGIDADMARSQAMIEERMGRRMAGAVTVPDVIAMTQANLSDEVILTHIRANGVAQPPQIDDLVTMRNYGVSDLVIKTMQQTPPPQVASGPAPYGAAPVPVIIQEHYHAPRGYPPHWHYHYGPPRRYYPPPRYGPPPRASWGFSFSH